MLSRRTFIEEIAYIHHLAKKEDDLSKALRDFCSVPDITYENDKATIRKSHSGGFTIDFYSDVCNNMLNLLSKAMGETYNEVTGSDLIEWATMTDYGTNGDYLSISDDTHDWKIRTANDMYDYLYDNYADELVFEGTLSGQLNGVKFALLQILKLKKKNALVANRGWEERDALMKLLINTIANQYMLATAMVVDDLIIPEDGEIEEFTVELVREMD